MAKNNDIANKKVALGADFNLFFLKKNVLAKTIQINEKLDLCDIK